FFFSSRRRHTRSKRDWSSDVCSSDLLCGRPPPPAAYARRRGAGGGRRKGSSRTPTPTAGGKRAVCRIICHKIILRPVGAGGTRRSEERRVGEERELYRVALS